MSHSGVSAAGTRRTDLNQLENAPMGGHGAAMKEGLTVSQIVTMEHDAVKMLYREYQTASDAAVKEAKAHLIINQLSQHAGKEETYLYPLMRKKLDDGDAQVEQAKNEHQAVHEQLYKLDQMKYSAEFDVLISKIMSDLVQHMTEEETVLLPSLEAKCTQQELVDIGRQFQSALTTTRPHPSAPREGFGAKVATAMAVPLDMAKDAMRFDEREKEEALH